jgi:hypothetical protein
MKDKEEYHYPMTKRRIIELIEYRGITPTEYMIDSISKFDRDLIKYDSTNFDYIKICNILSLSGTTICNKINGKCYTNKDPTITCYDYLFQYIISRVT